MRPWALTISVYAKLAPIARQMARKGRSETPASGERKNLPENEYWPIWTSMRNVDGGRDLALPPTGGKSGIRSAAGGSLLSREAPMCNSNPAIALAAVIALTAA